MSCSKIQIILYNYTLYFILLLKNFYAIFFSIYFFKMITLQFMYMQNTIFI